MKHVHRLPPRNNMRMVSIYSGVFSIWFQLSVLASCLSSDLFVKAWPVLLLLCFQQQLRIMLIIHLAATDVELFELSAQSSCLSPDLFDKASLASFIIALFSTTVADYANQTSCSHRR